MIPTRGAVQALAPAGRRATLHTSKGFATRQIGNGRQLSTAIRLPSGTASRSSPLARPRSSVPAGALAIGFSPSSTRSLSLWGYGWSSSSKKPEPPPSESTTATTAPAAGSGSSQPAQAEATPIVSEPVAPEPSPAAAEPNQLGDPTGILPADFDPYETISAIPERIGYLGELGLDYGWGPTSTMQWLLEHVHVYSGLPWWGSILATTLVVRALMWKPIMIGQEHSTRLSILTRSDPRYEEARKAMMEAMTNRDNQTAQVQRQVMKALEAEAGVKKSRAFLGMIQIPVSYGMFRLLQGMGKIPVPGMEDGGLLWFTNLALPDPYYLLPLIGPAVMMATLRITSKYQTPQQQATMKILSYVMVPLGFIFTSFLPSAVQFYFACVSVPGMFQTWIMMQPWFRARTNLPPLPGLETMPGSSSGVVLPAKPVSTNPWENLKGTLRTASSSLTERQERKKQASAKDMQKGEDEKIQAEYWEAFRERMAEKERRGNMKRRP